MINLTGRHIAILGGSSGIGLAIARLAATLGARVTLLGRTTSKLAQAAASIPDAATISVDMRDAGAVSDAIRAVERVDHLVLTAVADELARKAALARLSDERDALPSTSTGIGPIPMSSSSMRSMTCTSGS